MVHLPILFASLLKSVFHLVPVSQRQLSKLHNIQERCFSFMYFQTYSDKHRWIRLKWQSCSTVIPYKEEFTSGGCGDQLLW